MEPLAQTPPIGLRGGWRGQDVGAGDVAVRWELRRHDGRVPRATVITMSRLVALVTVLAAVAWALGFAAVSATVAATGLARLAVLVNRVRHAGDRDEVTMDHTGVRLARRVGGRTTDVHFDLASLQVQLPDPHAGPWLADHARRVDIGRHVPPPDRGRLAFEMRLALRARRLGAPAGDLS